MVPALYGGKPVRADFLPYGLQCVDEQDIAAVTEVLRTRWIAQGPKIEQFEQAVAERLGALYAVAVCNGTAALQAACIVAGLKAGDEVITSPLGFVASANSVVHCGARPVFCDIREDSLTLNAEHAKRLITKHTRALLPVDFAGHPSDLEALRALADEHELVLIEDAAHALGSVYKGRPVGSIADLTIFSFHPVKHITTGEGGMVLTNSEQLYRRLLSVRSHGMVRDGLTEPSHGPWYYEVHEPGYNFRITDFQCALGLSQLGKLDRMIERRREIVSMYNRAFASVKELQLPFEAPDVRSSYHIYAIQLKLEALSVTRKEFFQALRAENIGVQVHYVPMHLHPYYRRTFGYAPGSMPVAEAYYERAITLPLFPLMTDGDVKDVVAAIHKLLAYYSSGRAEDASIKQYSTPLSR